MIWRVVRARAHTKNDHRGRRARPLSTSLGKYKFVMSSMCARRAVYGICLCGLAYYIESMRIEWPRDDGF